MVKSIQNSPFLRYDVIQFNERYINGIQLSVNQPRTVPSSPCKITGQVTLSVQVTMSSI